jgi:hypothetical protein
VLLLEAFHAYLLAQFEGITQDDGARLHEALRPLVGERDHERLRQTLTDVLGLVLGGADAAAPADAGEQP